MQWRQRNNGMVVLKEDKYDRIYDGFQGVVVTVDPNTIYEDKKKIYLKEVEFDEEMGKHKASMIDQFTLEAEISGKLLKKKILKILKMHSIGKKRLPKIAITSDLEKLLTR